MTQRAPGFGLGVYDTRLNSTTLAAVGVATTDSAYTEAGPIPGHPIPADTESRWRPFIRGAQSVDIGVFTVRGGFPGTSVSDAGVVARLATETAATDYRGWSEPNLVTDWTAPAERQDSAWTATTAAVLPDSHLIIVISQASSTVARTWSYAPRTGTWTTLYNWSTASSGPGLALPIALAVDPTIPGRLLLWSGAGAAGTTTQIAYYSDDGGTTWAAYSVGMYDATVTSSRASVAVDPDLDWIMFHSDSQWASSDHGATWELVEATLTGTLHSVVRTPSGYWVSYLNGTSASYRLLPSARSPFSAATDAVLDTSCADVIVGVDYDGIAYTYCTTNAGTGRVSVLRGDSTGIYVDDMCGTFAAACPSPEWDVAVAACGQMHLIGGSSGSPANDLSMVICGGWSNVDQGLSAFGLAYSTAGATRLSRWSYGEPNNHGLLYLPYDTPANSGWTTTSTGTITVGASGTTLATTGAQLCSHTYQAGAATAIDYCCGEAVLQHNSGTLASAANAVLAAGVAMQNAAATGFQVGVYIGTDGLEVRDVIGGAVRATASLTTNGSAGQVHIRFQVRQNAGVGKATVWYKLGVGSTWTILADDVTLTQGAAGFSTFTFGHPVVGANNTTWRFFGGSLYCDWRYGRTAVGNLADGPEKRVLGLVHGRGLPGRGLSYPIPLVTSTSEDVGYIAASGGPTHYSETVALPAGHTYPVEHLHPDESRSPRVVWRSTGTAVVNLVYNQGTNSASWYGGALALSALAARFRTAVLAQDDGAGGWTTLGTLDKGWSSINYTVAGRVLSPRAGTATIGRYFTEGELVGGYVVMSTAGPSVARVITAQSAGFWTTDANVQRIRIEVEGIDGTETASGTGEIVHHSGVMVVYPTAETPRQLIRIQIPASQITPASYYEAGILAMARVVAIGADPGWDWSRMMEMSRTVTRSADGTMSVRRSGPPRRVLSYGWTDGVDLLSMRTLSAVPDTFGAVAGIAAGTEEDAWSSPLALIEQQLRSGEVPCLAFPRLPATTTTITDPTLYLHGMIQSDAVGVSGMLGEEGTNEILRVDAIAIEEVR